MHEVTPANLADYLRARGHLPQGVAARVEPLAWGVSNVVLRVCLSGLPDFVVKQSREQLRTQAAWFSRLDRIHREVALMRLLGPLLPEGVVPRVLFEEREDYLFGMEAVAEDHAVWKAELLAGRIDPAVAGRLGGILAAIHRQTVDRPDLAQEWSDREVFDQLRLDPFYRYVAERHAEDRREFLKLVDETLATRACIVHADFSPKNILLAGERLALVDFETGHYGDPAFDLGFFLSHLMLKAIHRPDRRQSLLAAASAFWERYVAGLDHGPHHSGLALPDLQRRAIAHLAGCLRARVDGKSPVDYLTEPAAHERVRRNSRELFTSPPARLLEALALAAR